jgi:hypothetical protein
VQLSHKPSDRESKNPQSWLSNRFPIPHSLKSAEATAVSALNQLTLQSLLRQRTEPSPSTVLSLSSKPLSFAKKIWLLNTQSVKLKRILSVFSTTRTVVLVTTLTVLITISVFKPQCHQPNLVQVQAALDMVTEDDRVLLYFERTTFTAEYLA